MVTATGRGMLGEFRFSGSILQAIIVNTAHTQSYTLEWAIGTNNGFGTGSGNRIIL